LVQVTVKLRIKIMNSTEYAVDSGSASAINDHPGVQQRISEHPASQVIDLTPRVWKTKFAHDPMRSDLALAEQ